MANPFNGIGYVQHGEGSEGVIILHDWMGDHSNYDLLLPFLDSERFTFACIDLRGYGLSAHIEGDHTLEQGVGDVITLADQLGWQRFHLMGHSMTGMVAQAVALRYSFRLQSLILITPVLATGIELDEETARFFQTAITDPGARMMVFDRVTGSRLGRSWGRYKYQSSLRATRPEILESYLQMVSPQFGFSEALQETYPQVPTLAVVGEHDLPIFGEDMMRSLMPQWFPNLTIQKIPASGHFPMQETPAFLAGILDEFLSTHSETSKKC